MSARITPDYRDLAAVLEVERRAGKTLALTNGCFDLLHVGHVRMIREAAALADLLVVALNDDASTRANKGLDRPVLPLAERMEVIAAIAGVAFVTSFGEATAAEILAMLRPDFYVKGTDWTPDTVPERTVVAAYGGSIVIAGDEKHRASSDLIARMRRN